MTNNHKPVGMPEDRANHERLRRLGDGLRRVHDIPPDDEAAKLAELIQHLE